MTRSARRKKGDEWELTAIRYLQQQGYLIVDTNVSYRSGEIDIIAQKENEYIFFEVKTRTNNQFGDIIESLTPQKTIRLFKTVFAYCDEHGIDPEMAKIEFIGIEKQWETWNVVHVPEIECPVI